jgi:phosphohistidine phosphatase
MTEQAGARLRSRTLVLLRHAKAEAASGTPDLDRRLSSRGYADATAAGAWLGAKGHLPELVICSPARRTRQTWHAVAVALTEAASAPAPLPLPAPLLAPLPAPLPAPTVQYERTVYDGGVGGLLGLVKGVSEAVSAVLLIGHNPTLSQLSALLDPAAGMDSDGLRTSGIAIHQVPGGWAECGDRAAPLTASHTARG